MTKMKCYLCKHDLEFEKDDDGKYICKFCKFKFDSAEAYLNFLNKLNLHSKDNER